jgi:hypothetical protein
MIAYKQFLSQDIIINPIEVNKKFTFLGSAITGSGIDIFLGKNATGSAFSNTTGYITTQYPKLVYDSIKQLYYSNFLSSSYGDEIKRRTLRPGRTEDGDRFTGEPQNLSYYSFFPTTLTYPKLFPTASMAEIEVLSIPKNLYGDYINPGSFEINLGELLVNDDGEGNLISNAGTMLGNIFYGQGIVTFISSSNSISTTGTPTTYGFYRIVIGTNMVEGDTMYLSDPTRGVNIEPLVYFTSTPTASNQAQLFTTGSQLNWYNTQIIPAILSSTYVNDNYLVTAAGISMTFRSKNLATSILINFVVDSNTSPAKVVFDGRSTAIITGSYTYTKLSTIIGNVTCSFSSSYYINETQYKCVLNDNEFNFSLNPSMLYGSGSLYDFATGSDFQPYITSIGLFNDEKELLAVAKLAQPIMKRNDIDTNIIINLDR